MPAPALALEGVRVLDLSRLLPGDFCSLLLADLGADVLKVEDCGAGDYVRWMGPYRDAEEESSRSALHLALNHNKRSMRIDLKHERGRELFLDLVGSHDVVLESFRPGVMARLGLGYEQLRERHPHIVYCAISGYGQDGSHRLRAGHDLNYVGQTGLLALSGEADGPPVQSAAQLADVSGSLMAALGILAAVRVRERTGEGQQVDVSLFDGLLSWNVLHAARELFGEPVRRGDVDLGGRLLCYRPYACSDGWVTLGALEPKFWEGWCRGVGREDLLGQQFEPPGSAAHGEVEQIFLQRTRDEWVAFNEQHDCCLEAVLELGEALRAPLVAEREMLVEVPHPDGPVERLGFPIRLSATPGDPGRLPAPALGEHTCEVLRELGRTPAEIDALLAGGAVAGLAEGRQAEYMTR